MSRAESEAKVLETVKEWLPDIGQPGSVIQITSCDPDQHDGAHFSVVRTPVFVCRRGASPPPGADAAAEGMGT